MKYTSLEEIKKDFDINTDEISEIKKKLKSLLKEVHAGNNKDGKFKDKVSALMYPKIKAALDFLKLETLPANRNELAEFIKEIAPYKPDEKKINKLDHQMAISE